MSHAQRPRWLRAAVAASKWGGSGTALIAGWSFGGLPVALLCLIALLVLAITGVGRRKLSTAHLTRSCPQCGYDLRGIVISKDASVAELLTRIGPLVCPECGKEWPLVPRLAGGVASSSIKIHWEPGTETAKR